ncbi:hypothetical protein LTR08_007048 [Meristemomyces frigidus]|nr:hypothetical protein LTR08_007048 [Meristemomyces frigidus]
MAAKLDLHSTLKMKSGYSIPVLGYGVYQTPAAVAHDVTHHAILSGYRHVDSATVYRNEAPSAAGMLATPVPRDQLFYTSKVEPRNLSYAGAKASVAATLQQTGLGYIDLYLLHAPYGGREARLGAWRALVESVAEGKVRSIGVSNYGVHHLEELEQWQKQQPTPQAAGILSINQIELHPWLARPDIVTWCRARSIHLEAYSPLVRSTKMSDPLLLPLAAKHGKTPAQILLRWGLQQGFVVLPKSVTHARIEQNADIFDFELDEGDMRGLETGVYEPCTWNPTTAPLSE